MGLNEALKAVGLVALIDHIENKPTKTCTNCGRNFKREKGGECTHGLCGEQLCLKCVKVCKKCDKILCPHHSKKHKCK